MTLLVLAACSGGNYPNSTFLPTTENNREVTALWNRMMFWGTAVFVIVETILIFTIIKYRRRAGGPEPRHVHGNTLMEITWTLAPALILVLIAVPTVRTIFKTQAAAPENSLQVEVIGHQWWWEFRYPEYGITTANELYLPHGRPVNFALRTVDVLHSFWIPALAGKRDLISNKTNYLWFTPDSTGEAAFNGSCNEYCGSSHANMKFRVFTVAAADFETWAKHNAANAVFPPPAAPADSAAPLVRQASNVTAPAAAQPAPPAAATTPWQFPKEKIPAHTMPQTPLPAGLSIPDAVIAAGDAQRGFQTYSRSACIGCHKIRGNPSSLGIVGPDLTHVGSRYTIAAGLFPNDAKHLAHWLKNARKMKPGSLMQTLGKGEHDPIMNMTVQAGGLTDEQIADITAYLLSLK
ncbi:MAG: cytochrome c oxidase subunit II [Gemmatimonadaceae bacterium]|nr:cytochrome c oxidase subunit II [Gemmatimonadaceae bacterium]